MLVVLLHQDKTEARLDFLKLDYTYKDTAEDVLTGCDTTNDKLIILPKRKNKWVISVIKEEVGGKFMKEFVGLRAKALSYLLNDGSEEKKQKALRSVL